MAAMVYMGGGYIQGIPARDLNEDETRRWRATIIEQQNTSGVVLYVETPAPKPGKPDKQPEQPEESDE
jgi:hypothetical protein